MGLDMNTKKVAMIQIVGEFFGPFFEPVRFTLSAQYFRKRDDALFTFRKQFYRMTKS